MASTAAIMRAHSRTMAAFDRTYKREVEKSENMQKAMFTAINALDSYSKGVKELSELKAFGQVSDYSYDKGTDSFYKMSEDGKPLKIGRDQFSTFKSTSELTSTPLNKLIKPQEEVYKMAPEELHKSMTRFSKGEGHYFGKYVKEGLGLSSSYKSAATIMDAMGTDKILKDFGATKFTEEFGIDLQADPTDLGKFKATEYAEEYKADPDAGMAKFGRFGDAYIVPVGGELAHVNEYEAMIIQMYGEQGEKYVQSLKEEPTINPYTGYKEYFVQELSGAALSAGISTGNPWLIGAGVVGTIGSSLFGSSKEEEAAKRQMDEISGTIGRLGGQARQLGTQFTEGVADLFGIQEEQLSQTDIAAGESMQSLSKNVQTAIKRGKGLRTAAPEQAILETTGDIAQAAEVQKGNIITSTEQHVTQAARQQEQKMGDITESIRGLSAEYGELEDVADQSFWDKIF